MKAVQNANENVRMLAERFIASIPDEKLLSGILNIVRLELITAYREGYRDGREKERIQQLPDAHSGAGRDAENLLERGEG